MANLDSLQEIKSLDSQNLSESILQLGKQCEQVNEEIRNLNLSNHLVSKKRIVVVGMGGSTLGTHIVQSVYFDQLKSSLEYVNGYHIPGYLDDDTLLVLSSYSGTTEEVLAAYQEAKGKTRSIIGICSGGDLGKLISSGEIEGYVFEPKFNPSGQPRMGLGYSILSQVLISSKLGYLSFLESDYESILGVIKNVNDNSKIEVPSSKNKAKILGQKLFGKVPFLLASEHLVGNIHTFANQINENSKSLSAYFTLPEADHHLIEGLPSTEKMHQKAIFFFLKSSLYSPKAQKRYQITESLVKKAGYETAEFSPAANSKIEQAFEFLTFGSWVSFYLAILYGRDPSPIPNVDFLKSELAKG